MAPQLRGLADLTEDQRSVPSAHIDSSQLSVTAAPGDPTPSHRHTHKTLQTLQLSPLASFARNSMMSLGLSGTSGMLNR